MKLDARGHFTEPPPLLHYTGTKANMGKKAGLKKNRLLLSYVPNVVNNGQNISASLGFLGDIEPSGVGERVRPFFSLSVSLTQTHTVPLSRGRQP